MDTYCGHIGVKRTPILSRHMLDTYVELTPMLSGHTVRRLHHVHGHLVLLPLVHHLCYRCYVDTYVTWTRAVLSGHISVLSGHLC